MAILAAFALPHPPLIIPEVGRGEEKKISKTIFSYEEAMRRAASYKPETVIVFSPHATAYYDYFHISSGTQAEGDFGQFNAPEVRISVKYDTQLVNEIEKICTQEHIAAGTLGEKDPELDHGTMVPLYFLNKFCRNYNVIRIGLSGQPCLNNYLFGRAIKEAVAKLNRRVVILASGDLSHKLKDDGPYGFAKEGPEFDKEITADLAQADFKKMFEFDDDFLEKSAECGLGSFQIMAGAFDRQEVKSDFLSYEGPFGVGYGICCFVPVKDDEKRDIASQLREEKLAFLAERKAKEDPYVRLARLSLETYVRTKKTVEIPADLPEELLTQRAGAFVSLKKDGRLRGCIGTFAPVRINLAHEIIENAISAGEEDPRFDPVGPDELDELVYDVDVLSPYEKVSSAADLDPKKYGVIVKNGERRGLLLPDLEGVDTVQEQIDIAKQKADIRKDEQVELFRFTVTRHL
jgi:MEMO1 family protein